MISNSAYPARAGTEETMMDVSEELRQRNVAAGQIEDAATVQEAVAHAFKGTTDVLLAILSELREMNAQQIMP